MNGIQQTLHKLVIEMLAEGGKAADSLIQNKLSIHPDNSSRELSYSKISDGDLGMILPEKFGVFPDGDDQTYIGKLLHHLGSRGMIDSTPPTFQVGSTRLAALKRYGSDVVSTDQYETDDVINMASQKKTDYGDLDIDVVFKSTGKDIAEEIERFDPSIYATKLGRDEVHVAVRMGNRVFQIDLLDVSNSRATKQFFQKSSFVDLASEVKGAFSIILLRAVAAAMDLKQGDAFEAVLASAENNPDTEFSKILQKQKKLGWTPVGARFSLGERGLKLVLDLRKPKRNDPTKMSRKTIDVESESRIGFDNLDSLAQTILDHPDASGSTIYHATRLADFIGKNKSRSQTDEIWSNFVDSADRNLKGGITSEEYNLGMKAIAGFLKKEWQPSIQPLTEARAGIGRFSGANKFTKKSALHVLRTLVDETNNEGKSSFDVEFDKNSSVELVEKMDSMFCHFGLDKRGAFFMESSNSGPVYAKNVEKRFGFNTDLLESFKYLQGNESFQDSLKDIFNRAGAFRYDAELFPVLTHKGTGKGNIIFVGTPYSKDKLGKYGAFVLFSCKLWNTDRQSWYAVSPEKNNELTNILKYESEKSGWSTDWKIYTNNEDMQLEGSFHVELGPVLANYLKDKRSFENAISIISNRKKTAEKEELTSELERVGEGLQNALNTFADQSTSNLGGAGSYIEGVVLKIKKANGDVFEVKGTSQEFDERKKVFWEDRVNALNLEKAIENHYAKEILGTKTTQPAALNRAIRSAAEKFQPSTTGDNRKVEFLEFLMPFLTDKEIDFKDVKKRAKEAFRTFIKEYKSSLSNFKSKKADLDPDSVRKTEEFYGQIKSKLDKLRQAVYSGLSGKSYYISLLNAILGFRVDRIVNFEVGTGRDPKDDFRKKVIIWNGRAQPWHVGHDAMIKKGKKMLKELGADAVYIMLVKGSGTSKDKSKNPLSEKDQYDLVTSVYDGDPQVVVADKFPKSGFIVDLLEDIHDKGHKVVGWLAGADRIGEYQKTLRAFSPSLYLEDHDYSPIDKDENGDVLVKMIETPRIMSGTQAREMALKAGFDEFYSNVAPKDISVNAKDQYKNAYDKIRESNQIEEISTTASIEGSPAAGGGAFGNMSRDNKEEKKRSRLNMSNSVIQQEAKINEVMNYLLQEIGSAAT